MSQAAAHDAESGRAVSRARRQALSRGGKTGLVARNPDTPPARAAVARPPIAAADTLRPVRPPQVRIPESRRPEIPAATAASEIPAAGEPDCGCQHPAAAAVDGRPAATGTNDPTSVILAPSGREAARRRRAERCESGRGSSPECRPSGRVRARPDAAPPKVEIGTTLAGRVVTGTQVERTMRVTGNEPGSCRAITGTEYIGSEQYGALCGIRPPASPAKVGVMTTLQGQRVTGNELGRSPIVTGDEAGTCKVVTGIDYITNERFRSVCRTKPEDPRARVGATATRGGVELTGNLVGRASKVTGDEPGSCRRLTGTQYTEAEAVAACEGVPEKAPVVHTQHGTALTGSTVGHAGNVTGDEAGVCRAVSGTDYVGPEQCPDAAGAPSRPVTGATSRTWGGQRVSGTQVGRSAKVTGDEPGTCRAITGASYVSPDRYEEHCEPGAVAAMQARTGARRAFAGRPLTGVQPGPDAKVTGITGRGACQPVSGTPYLGEDHVAATCDDPSAAAPGAHHRVRAPAGKPLPAPRAEHAEVIAPGDFSVIAPARSAQLRNARSITGTVYGAAGRITGPVALASGLVTGTAEFRYREHPAPAATTEAPAAATAPAVRERITGEGRDAGIEVTGDDWARSGRITGTEGLWATKRNPTARGDSGGRPVGAAGARAFKERERPEVPVSRITGSSGNAGTGAVVTLSGGARG